MSTVPTKFKSALLAAIGLLLLSKSVYEKPITTP